MAKACNPKNVMIEAVAASEAVHGQIDDLGLDYYEAAPDTRVEAHTTVLAEQAPPTPVTQQVVQSFVHAPKDIQGKIMGMANTMRNPSGLFGEDTIRPVLDFMTEHFSQYADDLQVGKSAYFQNIDAALDAIDVDSFPPTKQGMLKDYIEFYKRGGEFYGRDSGNALTQSVSNVTKNVIQSSPTVVLGNIFEGMVKLPTLYRSTFLDGLKMAQQNGGLMTKHPDLARQGVYGSSLGLEGGLFGSRKGGILSEGLIGLTDVPLKNISYYAGQLADGDGLKAVQKVAFVPRFGDLPSAYYNSGSRMAVQFLSYTANTYKMYGQLWTDTLRGATPEIKRNGAQGLLTFHVLTGAVGGMTATIPEPVQAAISAVFPESQEFFEENKNALTKLIQPGSFDNLFIGGQIAGRQVKSIVSSGQDSLEALGEGDIGRASVEAFDAAFSTLPITQSWLGDSQIQKAWRMGRDVALGELDLEDVPEEATEKFLPFAK